MRCLLGSDVPTAHSTFTKFVLPRHTEVGLELHLCSNRRSQLPVMHDSGAAMSLLCVLTVFL